MRDTIEFVIYGRVYCHLCDEMEAALLELLQQSGNGRQFAIDVIDVDQDLQLEALYDERVPVLVAGGRELCQYHLDAAAVRAYLADFR